MPCSTLEGPAFNTAQAKVGWAHICICPRSDEKALRRQGYGGHPTSYKSYKALCEV